MKRLYRSLPSPSSAGLSPVTTSAPPGGVLGLIYDTSAACATRPRPERPETPSTSSPTGPWRLAAKSRLLTNQPGKEPRTVHAPCSPSGGGRAVIPSELRRAAFRRSPTAFPTRRQYPLGTRCPPRRAVLKSRLSRTSHRDRWHEHRRPTPALMPVSNSRPNAPGRLLRTFRRVRCGRESVRSMKSWRDRRRGPTRSSSHPRLHLQKKILLEDEEPKVINPGNVMFRAIKRVFIWLGLMAEKHRNRRITRPWSSGIRDSRQADKAITPRQLAGQIGC